MIGKVLWIPSAMYFSAFYILEFFVSLFSLSTCVKKLVLKEFTISLGLFYIIIYLY